MRSNAIARSAWTCRRSATAARSSVRCCASYPVRRSAFKLSGCPDGAGCDVRCAWRSPSRNRCSTPMNDRDAIAALVSDLHWQIDQLRPRGIKDNAGNPYNPSYYKRGLQNAIDRGGVAVADYIRRYLYKPPSDGYRKLEEADSLDLACEALVADERKPYAHLFTDGDRAAARARLAPHIEAIRARKEAIRTRIDIRRSELPEDV